MNEHRLLHIANRIHLLLLRELGQGIDIGRMLGDRLYARDVLLVCLAQAPDTDLFSLALHFRQTRRALRQAREAARQPRAVRANPAAAKGFGVTLTSLFGGEFDRGLWADSGTAHSSLPAVDSGFDKLSVPMPPAAGPAAQRWFKPVTWRAR